MTVAIPDRDTVARLTARTLLEIEAVLFNADEPFTFTSGWASPVYIDCRRVIAFPRARSVISDFAAGTILREVGLESVDAIAGGETAGIPYAAWIAERLGLPMLYVRKEPKGFGRMAQIEGTFQAGSRVLLVEDLATDGASKVRFVDALRKADAKVTDSFVVFHYAIFKESLSTLSDIGVRLHALTTWWDVLAVAKESGRFDPATLNEVESFLNGPQAWSAAHGGRAQ